MKAPVRRVLAKVAIDYTDPTQDQAIGVTVSERANASFPEQTADASMGPTHKWASLDGAWTLDGTFHLAPLPEHAFLYQMGWWSARVANQDGAFAKPYPRLTVTYPLRPVASLLVAGDSLRREWPTAFRVRLYAADGTLLRERVVTGNTEVVWSEPLEPAALDVARQELEIMAWSRPGSHAKILEFFSSLQETYFEGDLVEVRLLEESESGSGSAGLGGAVTNELTVRLVNRGGHFDVTNPDSPLRELLRPNRRVRAWLGVEGAKHLWGEGWYAPFDRDLTLSRQNGTVIEPLPGYVATLRPGEGRVGGAVAVEEGTTNLVYDSGTIFRGTHISPDELPAPPPVTPVFCYTWTDLTWLGDIELAKTFHAGDVITISGWIYESGPWARLSVYGTENGTNRSFGSAFEPTGQIGWHYFEKTVVFQGETTNFRIEDGGWDYFNPDRADESQIWLVNVQMEEKPFATSFVDGTRAEGRLEYPFNAAEQKTLSIWVKPLVPDDYSARVNWVIQSVSALDDFIVWKRTTENYYRIRVRGINNDLQLAPGSITYNKWSMLTVCFLDNGTTNIYVNGAFAGSIQGIPEESVAISLGRRGVPDESGNNLFDELLILPYAASEEIIAELYRETRPLYDEWVPLGVFWNTDWDSEELEAMVRARDRMELLRRTTYEPGPLKQNVSLYELAQDVLTHAKMPPETYWLDPGLQDIVVPWGWVPPGSHRDALRIIAEAGLARAYCDRDGILRIQRLTTGQRVPLLDITPSDYFPPMRSPSSNVSVANRVVVTTSPLAPAGAPEEVARLTVEVPAGQTVVVRVPYEKIPVISPSATVVNPPSGVSIVSATYGAASAEIEIRNAGGNAATVTLSISGVPLSAARGEQVAVEDEKSIRELYLIEYQAPSNPLVQTRDHAEAIAQAILVASSRERRQLELEWRGNPALEAGDCVRIVGMPTEIVRQELAWVGALSAKITARRLS